MPKNRKNRGEDHPAWKGGRHITTHGYVRIYKPDHHRAGKIGYVLEHIVVLEEKLGIKIGLKDGEVHHIDGNKSNNNPENLELMTATKHRKLHTPLGVQIGTNDRNGIKKTKKTKPYFAIFSNGKKIILNQAK